MTNTPHTPASAVPAEPVVQIEIFGDTVSVNGVVIVHDGSQSLHHVAVHAAAERVAKPLGRPVRAQAIDAEGRATLVVHPDGHATDVELVESYDSEADAVAAAAPTVAAPVVSSLDTTALPSVVPASFAAPTGPPPTSPPPGVGVRPASGAPSGWPSKVVRMVAVAAALVAVIGLGVLLLGNRSSDTDQARDEADTTATPSPAAASEPADARSTTPASPAATDTAAAEAPVFSVVPLGGVNALRLTITTDTVPVTADIVVTAPGKTVNRSVTIEDSTYELDLGQIPAGTASWQVTVAGAATQTGTVAVTGPYVAPTPTPTALPVVPVVPVAPVPPVATATVTKTAKPNKPPKTQTPTKPTKTSKPKPSKPKKPGRFGEKKKNTFGDKGSNKKTSKPVDPDD